jgi:ATP-dependent helicase Lhr and Lhr-like helicase
MHAADLIAQAADGLLLPSATGERLINHYSFYAAFASRKEYRLVADGRQLGTMPVAYPIQPGD